MDDRKRIQERNKATLGSATFLQTLLQIQPVPRRSDSKSQQGSGRGCCPAKASSSVMQCITVFIPARIDRRTGQSEQVSAAVRSVANAPAPLPR